MHELIHTLSQPPSVIACLVTLCVLTGMALRAITTLSTTLSRERTRREIAAYIAEGALTPEQGERLLKAKGQRD